jgi:hypothetical protein
MTRRASYNSTMYVAKLVLVVGILSAFLSNAASISISSEICEPGSYAFAQNGSDCQICPPGTYSDVPGAAFCKRCLDTIYSNEGANSAELWNGDLYCVNLGSTDDDFLNSNSNSGDTAEHTVSESPTTTTTTSSIQIAVEFLSTVPSLMQSSGPSDVPSTMPSSKSDKSQMPSNSSPLTSGPSNVPSAMPSKSDESQMPSNDSPLTDDGDVPSNGFQSLALLCNDQNSETDRFEWHGRCKQCPAKHEMILYPILVLCLLAMIIALLEFLLPVCFTTHVWWGVEYLQMLYLIGISSVSWSPAAGFLFGRVLPIFAIDFNVSFSLQCLMDENWPQQEAADQLLVLSLPVIFLIILIFLSKISRNRIIRVESVSRWMTVLLNVGYLKLVLSSLEVLQLPTSWSADDLSAWVNSDSFYSTLGGLGGLLFYGLAFPFWFLKSIFRYSMFALALANADAQPISCVGQDNKNGERQRRDPRKKKLVKRKNELFLTLGIFPINLRHNAWWWPGIWMLRKFLFAIVLFSFPDGQFLILVVFLLINLLSVIVQQYFLLPLGDQHCEASALSKKKWHSIAAVDTVLQLCLATFIGIAFFSSWPVEGDGSTRSLFQKRMEDSLVLLIFFTSLIYLTVTIGVCCARPEPRFSTVASQIFVNSNNKSNSNINNATSTSTKDNSTIAAQNDGISIMRTFSIDSSSSDDMRKEIDFFSAGKDSSWNRQGKNANSVDEECGAESEPQTIDYGSANSSPYLVGEDDVQEESSRKHNEQGMKTISSRNRPGIFRSDSSIATNEDDCAGGIEDDTETVYEEVWVDEDTGEHILDPEQGNWMDAETGLAAIHPNNFDNHDIDKNN